MEENNPNNKPAGPGGPPGQRLSLPGPSRSELGLNLPSGPAPNLPYAPPTPQNSEIGVGQPRPPLHAPYSPPSLKTSEIGVGQPSLSPVNAQFIPASQLPPSSAQSQASQPPLPRAQFFPASPTSIEDTQVIASLHQAIVNPQFVSPQEIIKDPPFVPTPQHQAMPGMILDPEAQRAIESSATQPATQDLPPNPFFPQASQAGQPNTLAQQPMQAGQSNMFAQQPVQNFQPDQAARQALQDISLNQVSQEAMEDAEFVPASLNRPFKTMLPPEIADIPAPPGYYWAFLGHATLRLAVDLDAKPDVPLPMYFDKNNPPPTKPGSHWALAAEMNGLQLAMVYRATPKENEKSS